MKIINIIKEEILTFLNESRRDYLQWKRKNVSLRGQKEENQTENGGMAILGQGLYTAYLGNRELSRQYGKVYFLVNAIPKKPIVFNTLNDWEIWEYNTLIVNWCIKNGFKPSSRTFYEHTQLREEIMKLGYDGVAIKGREMVNYTPPDNVIYFKNEYQLENYYENTVGLLNENVNNNIKFTKTLDEDRTIITATVNNNKIGSVISEILFNDYYEFEDVLSEDEFNQMFPDDTIVKIEHIEVNDNYKNSGIATTLMNQMMNLMKNEGYTQFYLNASPMGFSGLNLSQLVRFYEKFGFKTFLNQGRNSLMYQITK